jgi:hypothetical protein
LDVAAQVHQGLDGFRHEGRGLARVAEGVRAGPRRFSTTQQSPLSTARITATERPSLRAYRTKSSRPVLGELLALTEAG